MLLSAYTLIFICTDELRSLLIDLCGINSSGNYHIEVGPSFAQQQSLEQEAQSGDFTDVHLVNHLSAMLQNKPETALNILLKELQQVFSHCVRQLKQGVMEEKR